MNSNGHDSMNAALRAWMADFDAKYGHVTQPAVPVVVAGAAPVVRAATDPPPKWRFTPRRDEDGLILEIIAEPILDD